MAREKSQDGSSPLFYNSVMQVFVSSQGASATVSLPDLSMSFVFLFFGFPAGILELVGRSAYLSITIFFEITYG
ncbi:MAG TPA: hypothetical protein DD001_08435 [Microcoleaceae bacterium UBA10368]|nr:hypothetical protein [Microcoleaceae cyanobacterium UBA10368]